MKIKYVISFAALAMVLVFMVSAMAKSVPEPIDVKVSDSSDISGDEDFAYVNDGVCFEYDEPVGEAFLVDPYVVGRLAKGIRLLKEKRDHGVWFYCGKELDEQEKGELSVSIAYHVLLSMSEHGLDVSPYGVVATAYNESGLDACALGLYPRKWGYKEGILKPRKRTVSHTREEISEFKDNPIVKKQYRRTGIDLGICQILSRFYRDQTDDMMTLGAGIGICVREMKSRSLGRKTNTPWLYWRGSETLWYREKIRKRVKLMDPPYGEIDRI